MEPGDVIGTRFVIETRHASGGMGTVFRALDRLPQETVALAYPTAATRALRELCVDLACRRGTRGGASPRCDSSRPQAEQSRALAEALEAAGEIAEAAAVEREATALIRSFAADISNAGLRESCLTTVPDNLWFLERAAG